MAIPGIPNNLFIQQGNQQVLLTWDISVGATSYSVQRSLDGVTFATIASPVLNKYLDIAVTIGVQYFYQVASTNLSGTSAYTTAQSIVPAPNAELSLGELRLRAQQRADRVNSNFVTLPEWNYFINNALYELYDLLITADEEYYVADPVIFTSTANQSLYPLPDGTLSFTNGNTGGTFVAPPFYKFKGQDLGLNTANNAFVTVNKFMFQDRNRFVYPNTASTIYGVFNLQYRLQGSNVKFIPTPSANQPLQMWYIPRLRTLLQDNDITTLGISGWLQYVIIRAAKYALDKEESDTTKLDQELMALNVRIVETAANRDTGQPDRVTDVRQNGFWGSMSGGYGNNGPIGGY